MNLQILRALVPIPLCATSAPAGDALAAIEHSRRTRAGTRALAQIWPPISPVDIVGPSVTQYSGGVVDTAGIDFCVASQIQDNNKHT